MPRVFWFFAISSEKLQDLRGNQLALAIDRAVVSQVYYKNEPMEKCYIADYICYDKIICANLCSYPFNIAKSQSFCRLTVIKYYKAG